MRALGVDIEIAGDEARVRGVGFAGLAAASGPLDCGNSGTTIRLLMGLLAGRPFETELFGDASLTKRPMRRVAEPLRRMGATVDGRTDASRPGDVFPPVRVRGGALAGVAYDLPVASAQLKSALVLAGLQATGVTTLREPGRSRDHTERMLRAMGAPIAVDAGTGAVVVDPRGWDGKLRAIPIVIPGDLSSATFLFVAAATVAGSDVNVENVGLNPTRTGALDALVAMGADIDIAPASRRDGRAGRPRARPCVAPARHERSPASWRCASIDEIPALAVAAALAEGDTVFADLAELRVKESDRIVAIARELRRAGVAVEERPDGFVVSGLGGRPPAGGTVQPEHDHRIAMAGAVLGLSAGDETIVPAADIATSFPTFAETLAALGAADRDCGGAGERSAAAAAVGDGAMQTSTSSHLPSVARKSMMLVQSVALIALRQTPRPVWLIDPHVATGHRCSQLAAQGCCRNRRSRRWRRARSGRRSGSDCRSPSSPCRAPTRASRSRRRSRPDDGEPRRQAEHRDELRLAGHAVMVPPRRLLVSPAKRQVDAGHRVAAAATHDRDVVPPMVTAAPTPISTPPIALRVRFSSQPVAMQLPLVASTAKPAPMATAPAIASSTGPTSRGGCEAGAAARWRGGAACCPRCARAGRPRFAASPRVPPRPCRRRSSSIRWRWAAPPAPRLPS